MNEDYIELMKEMKMNGVILEQYVYLAEYWDVEAKHRFGVYETEFDAMLACMYKYTQEVKQVKLNVYPNDEVAKSVRYGIIGRGQYYHISKKEVKKFEMEELS